MHFACEVNFAMNSLKQRSLKFREATYTLKNTLPMHEFWYNKLELLIFCQSLQLECLTVTPIKRLQSNRAIFYFSNVNNPSRLSFDVVSILFNSRCVFFAWYNPCFRLLVVLMALLTHNINNMMLQVLKGEGGGVSGTVFSNFYEIDVT